MGSEIDQLCKICHILGVPDLTVFPEGTNTSRLLSICCYEEVSFCFVCCSISFFFIVLTLLSVSSLIIILSCSFHLQTFLISYQMLAQKLLTWFWWVLLIQHASLTTFYTQHYFTSFDFSDITLGPFFLILHSDYVLGTLQGGQLRTNPYNILFSM